MRSPAVLTWTAITVAALAGCGGGRHPAREPGPRSVPPADAGVDAGPDVALLTELADGLAETLGTMATITSDAADCPTMARELGGLFDQAASLFRLAEAQAADPAASRLLTAAMDTRAGEVEPLVDRIVAGLARCQHDPDVAAAMARMPTF
jgi:hypothetical protein